MPKLTAGTSGNPSGRRHGSRNSASLLCDKLAADEIGDVMHAVLRKAKEGDADCARLILSRCWPARRGSPVRLYLPHIATASDVTAALGAIVGAVANGEITCDEAGSLATLIEAARRSIETDQLEQRIAALESRHAS